jgi:hypothetical protein
MTFTDELTDRDYLASIWQALRRMEQALSVLPAIAEMPAPIIHIPPSSPPDLADIVTAVESIKGSGPTAADIANAIASVLSPGRPDGSAELHQMTETLKDLEHVLRATAKQGAARAVFADRVQAEITNFPATSAVTGDVNVTDKAARQLGIVSLTQAVLDALETISVGNFPASYPVTGTFWQATQPISGTVTVANPTTNPETGLAKDATLLRRFGDHVTKAGVVSTIGDNTLHTPTSGKKVRLYWIGLSTSQDNAAENLIQVKLTDADGTVKYRWCLGNPGAFVGGRTIEGSVNEPLILNLATTDAVNWNVDLEEVT